MPYTPDPLVTTEPTDLQKASTMALEFRTLKAYIQTVLIPLIGGKIGTGGGTSTGAINITYNGEGLVLKPPADAAGTFAGVRLLNFAGTSGLLIAKLSQSYGGSLYGANAGDVLVNTTGNSLVFSAANVRSASMDAAGAWTFLNTITGSISGNAASASVAGSASVVPWTGVSGRPTLLSQFTNDSGFLTSVAWTSVTGRPTLLSQFTNDLSGSGISSFQGRGASAAVLLSSDVSGALGYTPYNAGNPAGYTTLAAVSAAGYQTSAGSVNFASSTPWAGITGKPTGLITAVSASTVFYGSDGGTGHYVKDISFNITGTTLNIVRTIQYFDGSGGGGGA